MIIADRKPIDEILDMIKDCKKILIVGCKGCVTVCNVGGMKEVGILASTLKIAKKKEGRPLEVDERTLERQCDPEYVDQLKEIVNHGGYELTIMTSVPVDTPNEGTLRFYSSGATYRIYGYINGGWRYWGSDG